MIPLTTLYDYYIDWPKLSEQKKPFEYIVLPPLKRGRRNKNFFDSQRIRKFYDSKDRTHLSQMKLILVRNGIRPPPPPPPPPSTRVRLRQ